ncbi:MAG TPA: alpha/beta hydrolase [Kofleriaceae bacterium]|nr:alpha/beta hydrolase [Kofleriaceae bacterium]
MTLARRLAERGITSLRLDLSGIGDSRSVPGSLSFRQSSVADTRAAMDQLAAEVGASRFVIFGLCSGADNALATAEVDPRVVGIVVLDPPAYITPRAQARRLAGRVRALGGARATLTWGLETIARRVRAIGRAAGDAGQDDKPEVTGGREVPPPAVFRTQLAALVARKVAILAVYSGALGARYNHADQLFELFPELRGKVDRAYFPAANHMFTELDAQAALVRTVLDWVERRT